MKANRILCFTLFTLNIVWGNLEGLFLTTIESKAENLPPLGADSWIAIFSRIQPNIYFLQQA